MDPNTYVFEDCGEDFVLVTRVVSVTESAFEVVSFEDVDGRTKVPLVNEISSVEVAVTVTVDSVLVPLLLSVDSIEVVYEPPNVEDGNEESEGSGVVGGVDVRTDWEESSTPLVTAEVSVGVEVSTAGIVSVPNEDTETRTSLVAAAIVVASRVVDPTSTFTSTTLAVTVASGTRGSRWRAAFRRTSFGLCRGTSTYLPCCISESAMVRVGAWRRRWSASSLRIPNSEVKSPSFILEPASRGDLESGLDIFNLFAGWSMLEEVSKHMEGIQL